MTRLIRALGILFLLLNLRGQESSCQLDGRIVDILGSAIEGAQVSLANTSGEIVASKSTDADGRFAFPGIVPGTYRIDAYEQGFRRESRTAVLASPGDRLSVHIGLIVARITDAGTVRVSGTVRTAEGRPVFHAAVTVRPLWNSRFAVSTSTNAHGRYSVDLDQPGPYEIHVRAPDRFSAVLVFLLDWRPRAIDVTLDGRTIDLP
jgi:protocatechuate 3,4-dioxygenase beta subunit